MSDIPSRLNPSKASPDAVQVAAQKRRVIKSRPLEPLDPERRYVQPHTSRVALCTSVFSWMTPRWRKVDMRRRVAEPNGLNAPTPVSREKARFNQYFELGTGIRVRPGNVNWELNVHRNRVIFLLVLLGVILYCLHWVFA